MNQRFLTSAKSAAKCDVIIAEPVGDAKTNAELSSISSQRIALGARKNGMFQNLMEIIPFSVGGIGLQQDGKNRGEMEVHSESNPTRKPSILVDPLMMELVEIWECLESTAKMEIIRIAKRSIE